MNNIPVNYAPFCEEKKCPEFIRWQIEGTTCESCKKVGQSYDINEYPPDCLHIEDIEDYKAESFEAAKQKLINTFKFEEMLSDEEIDKTNDLLDMLLKTAKGKP